VFDDKHLAYKKYYYQDKQYALSRLRDDMNANVASRIHTFQIEFIYGHYLGVRVLLIHREGQRVPAEKTSKFRLNAI
jgi:hypothetical protein